MREKFQDMQLGRVLRLYTESIKENVDKLGFVRIKNSCFAKDPTKSMIRQVKDWEKIFSNLTNFSFQSGAYSDGK